MDFLKSNFNHQYWWFYIAINPHTNIVKFYFIFKKSFNIAYLWDNSREK